MPILEQGSSGPDVQDLQQKLKALGFDPNGVDGNFGPGTKAAVIAFQKSKGLPADGVAGPQTLSALQPGGADAVSAVGGATTQPKWLDGQTLFGFRVERHELPRLHNKPYYPMGPTERGVIHTTEGATIDGALTVLAARFDGPHFVVGGDRIVQGRPLYVQGAALRQNPGQPLTNPRAEIQIECVGFAQTKPWMFDDWSNHVFPINPNTKKPVATPASFHGSTLKPLVALLAWLTQNTDIPLSRPSPNWKDDMSDCPLPWAVANNHRRLSAVWDSNATGWFGHVEVQHQEVTNHFDPGALNYSALFAMVQAL